MTSGPVRVLVVDDSTTSRALLVALCRSDPDVEVVGEASNGSQALDLTKQLRPSLVVMDIDMPLMNGFEATKRIMIEEPTPIIIVTSHYDATSVEIALQAVGVGALTALPKPGGPGTDGFDTQASRLVSLVKALADVKVIRSRRVPEPSTEVMAGYVDDASVAAVGVAASTGGPAALYRFLEALPRTFAVPLLVVQHIAEGFVPGLVRWLGSATVLPVRAAEQGEPVAAGVVYVAPDDQHLGVLDGVIRLSDGPKVGGFRPSANVLFQSLAQGYGPRAAGVVLTGMGSDGLTGAGDLRAAGGLVLAQDEASSVVFGMPRAVADAGLADIVGPVDHLAQTLISLVRRGTP